MRALAITALMMAAVGPARGTEPLANEHFRRGRALIEENSGDALDASREGLVRGAEEVERAIAEGYADKVGAYRLLGLAWYRAGARGGGEGPESEKDRDRAREALRRAVLLAPGDAEVLAGYADVVSDRKEQLTAYRRVLAVAPDHAGALFAVGVLLTEVVPDVPGRTPRSPGHISDRQFEEGVRHLKRAARAMDRSKAKSHGRAILEVLESHGRKRDAEEVERVFAAKGVRLDRTRRSEED